jgi:hypothetical protein
MARKVGQIIARGDRSWLIRVDHETEKRKYHNQTIYSPHAGSAGLFHKEAGERDLDRDLERAKITRNETDLLTIKRLWRLELIS